MSQPMKPGPMASPELIRQENLRNIANKMSLISPGSNIPGLLHGQILKYVNLSNIKNYADLQYHIVNARTSSAEMDLVMNDQARQEVQATGSTLRLELLSELMTSNHQINVDRLALETSFIESLDNVNKLGLKEYGSASKLSVEDLMTTLASLDGLQSVTGIIQELGSLADNLFMPALTEAGFTNNIPKQQALFSLYRILEFATISMSVLADLAKRAVELKPNAKAQRHYANTATGYQKPSWLTESGQTPQKSIKMINMQFTDVNNFISTNILNTGYYTAYNQGLFMELLGGLSEDALKYVASVAQNSGHITASEPLALKALGRGYSILMYYDACNNRILSQTLSPQVQAILSIISSYTTEDPNQILANLCSILGIQPMMYSQTPYDMGPAYALYTSLAVNNPNLFFGYLLYHNKSSDLLELSKRLIGTDGYQVPKFTINEVNYLINSAKVDGSGVMYRTPAGINSYLSSLGMVGSQPAVAELTEILASMIDGAIANGA